MKKLKFVLSVAAYYLVAALYFVLGYIAIGLQKWWKLSTAIISIPLCLWGLFSMFKEPFWPLFIFFTLLIFSIIAYAINNAKELNGFSDVEERKKEQERLRAYLRDAKAKRMKEVSGNNALPDDYPTPQQIDKIEEEYRNNHWCQRCLAMFEEECDCDDDDDDYDDV